MQFTGIPLYLTIILSPLIASIITGVFGFALGKKISHSLTILGVLISTICSYIVLYQTQVEHLYYTGNLYTWMSVSGVNFNIGLLVDNLTAVMLTVVTSISLMVHIYTIGYMAHEEGYQRFFSYISLFTFMMIMLVLANNFVQLFFGWEGVGLVSYLLIGFYTGKESAVFASLKAFLVNRVGDFGFLLGIGLIYAYCGSLDYSTVFAHITSLSGVKFLGTNWSLITVICVLLFLGAMGKSAQFPLHVWLPDSMEGPTPISALIHAATMVTAGIFMVARLSPIYNLSTTALSMILILGSINCLFLGLLGLIQNDIKRVIAYSTLSQLGYMAIALGCGNYSIAIFHLMTHAFFKGLLFLAAGSVIIAMHHEQDMTKMGGLAKYMPITYITMLIGSLALAGIPPFAGFFSKDMILAATLVAKEHGIYGGSFAVFAAYSTVFITAIYSFRLIFMTFHGKEHFRGNHHGHDDHTEDSHHGLNGNPKESPWVVTLPLVLMAIPSAIIGWIGLDHFVSGQILSGAVFNMPWFMSSEQELITPLKMVVDSFSEPPVYFALCGIIIAFIAHKVPAFPKSVIKIFKPIYLLMDRKYFMDDLFINVFAPMGRGLGRLLWNIGDIVLIDGLIVNGAAKVVNVSSLVIRRIQSGYVNSYATFMILGVILLLTFCTRLIFS
jgi:NADH-quinone oxidoreductase subunit L